MVANLEEPFGITPAFDMLLRGNKAMPFGLYHLQLATAEQLTRLHYSWGSLKHVKAMLRILADHSYVQIGTIPTRTRRTPNYFALGSQGVDYLQSIGMGIKDIYRLDKETDKHSFFLEHTLSVNDLVIAAAMLRQRYPNIVLDEFKHERVIKRHPINLPSDDRKRKLIPDAVLSFRLRTADSHEFIYPVFLELELSEKSELAFKEKIRNYSTFIRWRGAQMTVAYITTLGMRYLDKMRQWARAALKDQPESLGKLFLFASIDDTAECGNIWLEPIWYTAFDNQAVALLGGGQ